MSRSDIDSTRSMRRGNKMAATSKAGPSNDIQVHHAPIDDIQDFNYSQLKDEHNGNPTNPVLSKSSMASNPMAIQPHVAFVQMPSEFKMKYHPRSAHTTLYQMFDKFSITQEMQHAPVDKEPWHPFRSYRDFEFSEIVLDATLNKSQINALLELILLYAPRALLQILGWYFTSLALSHTQAQITLKNESDLLRAWNNAVAELTPFSKHKVPVIYKRKEQEYEVHIWPVWDWALNLLDNPLLTLHFVWDACHSSLPPNVKDTVPFCFILYAKKLKLSSHGTIKGYPVVVQCANLPIDICNGEGFGGGHVVRWWPIVPDNAAEEGKLGYTTLKHVVTSSTTYQRAIQSELWRNYKKFSVFMGVVKLKASRYLKHLDYDLLRLWKHLLEELKKILMSLGHNAQEAFNNYRITNFSQWYHLNHSKFIINITFIDGNKYQDLSKQTFYLALNILMHRTSPIGHQLLHVISSYLQLDSWIGLDLHTERTLAAINAELLVFDAELKAYITCAEELEVETLKLDWNFLKTHLWKHVDIVMQALGNGGPDEDIDIPVAFSGHIKLGSLVPYLGILDVESHGQTDHAFQSFCWKFNEFINNALPTYGHQLMSWVTFLGDFKVHEHHYLKVNYEPFEFALVQPYTAREYPNNTHAFFTKDASNPPPNSDEKYLNNMHAFVTKDASNQPPYLDENTHDILQEYPNNMHAIFTKDALNQPSNLDQNAHYVSQEISKQHACIFYQRCLKLASKLTQVGMLIIFYRNIQTTHMQYPNNTCAFFTKDASAQNHLALTALSHSFRDTVMPHNMNAGEYFEAKINAISDDSDSDNDGSDGEVSESNLDEVLKKQYLALSSAIPAHSRNRMLKKTSPLDSSITHQGQNSPNAKLKGAMAKLYQIIPKDLHASMETYPHFRSLFHSAVSSKRSNILHSIKDCAGVIFSPFKLDPSIFANQPSNKQDNKDLLVLLKRNGEGDYIHLAPVLFVKPNAMSADDFLKSPVLVKYDG
ncbi:hypothetical protein BDR06DRAFT_970497 [Suillus hirtellus]|nr:hypothetical protein BDR06DRAFT_970497 [Suillus hirtellus]